MNDRRIEVFIARTDRDSKEEWLAFIDHIIDTLPPSWLYSCELNSQLWFLLYQVSEQAGTDLILSLLSRDHPYDIQIVETTRVINLTLSPAIKTKVGRHAGLLLH